MFVLTYAHVVTHALIYHVVLSPASDAKLAQVRASLVHINLSIIHAHCNPRDYIAF